MNLLKFIFSTALVIAFFSPLNAQEWVSYQSEQQINELLDTGDELYMATDAGLVVMNKATLEKSIYNRANSNLNNNHIQSITQKSDGTIWIGTYDVIMSRFDGSDFQDVTIPDSDIINQNTELYDFEIAPNGDFWIATDDGVVQRTGQDWIDFEPTSIDPLFFEAWNIEINNMGEVYLASNDVFKFDNGSWNNISENNTGFQNYLDSELFFSSTGDLYVAGDLDQVWRFDGTEWEGLEFNIDVNGSQITGITEDVDGVVYVMGEENGIFKVENDLWVLQDDAQAADFDNKLNYFHIDEQNKRWMNSNLLLSVYENGSTQTTTISDYTLETNAIGNIEKGANGEIYFIRYFQDEMSVLNEDDEWTYFPALPSSVVQPSSFRDVLHVSDQELWLSTDAGLYNYDGNDWTHFSQVFGENIARDSEGRIYMGDFDTVFILDNGNVTEYTPTNSQLSSLLIINVAVDANDNLWISSFDWDGNAAIQTVATDGTWTTYTDADFPDLSRPNGDFLFDLDGNVWIPNAFSGALMFDGTSWTNPNKENVDQIVNSTVDDIEMDLNGKLYFSHQYGVTTMFNGEWDNLIIDEVDVPNNNTSAWSSIAFDDEGTLWWGSSRHGVFAYATGITSSVETKIEQNNNFTIYPNPATDYTILDFAIEERATVNVLIYNTLGQLQSSSNLGTFSVGTFQERIDLSLLPKGVYNVQLQVNAKFSTKRVILQ